MINGMVETIRRHDLIERNDTVVVGVSGGADSLALLHGLWRLQDQFHIQLVAATLDHGIRGEESAADVAYVRQIAERFGIELFVGRADVPKLARQYGLGIEEAARQVRYTFLLRVARRVRTNKIAVGHNRDDQAETVLMHLIRGSGLNGLRGMLPATPISQYHLLEGAEIDIKPEGDEREPELRPVLIRPLLDTPRSEISSYLSQMEIKPRQDSTNADLTYFRNRLRHEVIPFLETLNPNLRAMLARTADTLREDSALIETVAAAAVERTVRESGADWVRLDRAVWNTLSLAEKRHVIRSVVWRLRPKLRDVSFVHVQNAIDVSGQTGASATLPDGLILRNEYDTLWIGSSEREVPQVDHFPWQPAGAICGTFRAGEIERRQFGSWVFEARPLTPDDDLDAIHADPMAVALRVPRDALLRLRTRQAGDWFMPRGMGGKSQKLSDTFINCRVPAAVRDHIPLLMVGEQIAWFVAPTQEGVRGRMAHWAEPALEPTVETVILIVSWQYNNHKEKPIPDKPKFVI